MESPSLLRRTVPLMLAVAVLSCGGDGGVAVDDVILISVSPGTVTLTSIGATAQLSATGSGGGGATVTWSSSNTLVASVGTTGLVTAVANGTASITASAGGAASSGSAVVTVAQAVASITVTPDAETILSGQMIQLTAIVQDAGGTDVAPALSWTSSDEGVATVDSDGLVTGISDGSVVITASQDGVSGTSSLDVIRGDFMPTGDGTLAGTVEVGELMIPAGVTITVTADATINATGPMTIAGSLIGDCVGLTLTGGDPITISGTVSNVCTTEPGAEGAPLDIVGGAVVTLDGATISSSGDVSIANTPPAAPVGPGARVSAADPVLSLVGTTVRIEPAVASSGEDVVEPLANASSARSGASIEIVGGEGTEGKGIQIAPGGVFILGATDLVAQDGGEGGAATGPIATGGKGGTGGSIVIGREGDPEPTVVAEGAPAFFVRVTVGGGGPGGTGTATAPQDPGPAQAPSVSGRGGAGGNTGSFSSFLPENITSLTLITAGIGGAGTATAPDGVSADQRPQGAQIGGNATGFGGSGGTALVKSALVGSGGPGSAAAGRGGDGSSSPSLPKDAAAGGAANATGGGVGGTTASGGIPVPPVRGDASATGGNGGTGGDACQAADPAISFAGFIEVLLDAGGSNTEVLNVPPGGGPISLASVIGPVLLPGGEGGGGGSLEANASADDPSSAQDGVASVGPGGNGGDGGAGLPVGLGGSAGSTSSLFATLIDVSFKAGGDGPECSVGVARGAAPLTVAITQSQSTSHRLMTLTGVAPWIDVAGTLTDDGTVSLSGTGTMAGTPNIDVLFAGTFDGEAGTLVGTYTMDPNKVISPLHPLVYSLDLAIPPDP